MARRRNTYRDNQDKRAAELLGQADTLQEIEVTAEKITLYSESKEDEQKKNTDVEIENDPPLYRYPLTITESYPAYIKFRAIKVDGADFREAFGDVGRGAFDLLKSYTPAGVLINTIGSVVDAVTDNQDASEADKEVTKEEKDGIIAGAKKLGQQLDSFEDLTGGTLVGSVMLPLQQSLTFQDGVVYNEANLGIAGAVAGDVLQGKNPFAGIMDGKGNLGRAASSIATQIVAKNAASVGGAALGSKFGVVGSVFGAGALGGVGEGIGAAVKNASRVTTNPNQRTLFEKVNLREFTFTFKMIANNAKEAKEIRNIVKFFREEVYPLPIETSTGASLGYEFPNMFEIDVKNFKKEDPAPKIQRCYLQNVQTVYNATANSMHTDGNFVEVDVSLTFKEIVALDKKKVREGY